MSELYTSSRLRVLRDCLRRHYYQYVLNIRTKSTFAMEFGTVLHAALEAYLRTWQARRIDHRLAAAFAAIDASPFSPFEKAKLRALVGAYHLRWGNEPWEIIAVEVEFRYELPDDHDEDVDVPLIGGKIDALIRDLRDGRVYVLEHKSTGADVTPGSPYWERLALDTQVSIYIDGATVLGHDIAGCIYDVIKRPEHEQLKATPVERRSMTTGKGCKKCGGSAKAGAIEKGTGHYTVAFASEVKVVSCDGCAGTGWKLDKDGQPEAPRYHQNVREHDETLEAFEERVLTVIGERPDDFLIRNVVVRLDDDLPRMRQTLRDTIQLERLTTASRLRIPNSDACARYGTMCPFFAACSGRASIEDPHLYPRGETAHPELAAAA